MTSRRRAFSSLLSVLVAGAWLGAALPADARTRWDYALYVGVTHPIAVQLRGFADEVRTRTRGELDIVIRPAGELPIRATDMVKAVGDGIAQMGQAASSLISGQAPVAGLANAPFLIRDYRDLDRAWPVVAEAADREFRKFGVTLLFHSGWPPTNVFGAGRPVRSLADLAGRRLRSLDARQAELFGRFRAASVTLAPAEVPVALERGVVEAVVTSAFNAVGSKWAEFLRWAYVAEINVTADYQVVNRAALDKLPPEVQAALREVAAEWSRKMLAENAAAEEARRQDLRTRHGVQFAAATEADLRELGRAAEAYWQTWAQQAGPEGVAMMADLRKALGR
jgi:TRAP-type C4-dicarboxylate transport system substrate-binding protein